MRKAIEMVKPYFLTIVTKRLEEESNRLLSGFRFQENKQEVLAHYLTVKKHPEILESKLLDRLDNYHPIKDELRQQELHHPLDSDRFKFRDLLAQINVSEDVDPSAAVTEQEKQLRESTRQQLEQVSKFKKLQKLRNEMINDEIIMESLEK